MDTLSKILYELKTIAKIQKNARIITNKEFIVIENNSLIQGAYRWWKGESRYHALLRINQTIGTAIYISELMMEIPDKAKLIDIKRLTERLEYARQGVENLCETYSTDTDFIGKAKPLIPAMIVYLDKAKAYIGDD